VTAMTAENPLAVYTAEIGRRGGETSIEHDKDRYRHLAVTDTRDGLYLLHVRSWRYYKTAKPRLASLSYLCGTEDGQLWAVRVPGTIMSVPAALAWLEPAAVTRARAAGKRVLRQGDVYAVETTRAHDGLGAGGLPGSHSWNPRERTLWHPQHGTLSFAYPVRFVPQRVYGMGRSAGRGPGD
jgi:hypothetical protein